MFGATRGPMRYRAFQAQTDLMAPARLAAGLGTAALAFGPPWLRQVPPLAHIAAGWEMLTRAGLTHHRRDYGFTTTRIDGEDVPVHEEVVSGTPFGDLVRFRKEGDPEQPRILLVAPLSGHFATLLRGTVETLLPDNDVYITDWQNARDAPLSAGAVRLRRIRRPCDRLPGDHRPGRPPDRRSASPAPTPWRPWRSWPRTTIRRRRSA